ncbi:ABC transporter permease [candidate division KSB1 bacterium]
MNIDEKFKKPPKLAGWILTKIYPDKGKFTSLGDFEECYNVIRKESGIIYAWFWYWKQIFKSVPAYFKNKSYWSLIMFKHYLKTAIRLIRRQKGFSLINISGLAAGITCCLLTLLWVQYEKSYDKFHENVNQIYRVVYSNSDREWKSHAVPGITADFLKENYPEVVDATITGKTDLKLSDKDKGFFISGFFVHSSFFNIFSFPFLKGDPETAFEMPPSIVISEDLAKRFFGDEDPIGKILRANDVADLTVTGVVRIPENSSIKFDFLLSYRLAPSYMKNWNNWGPHVYVQLQKECSYEDLNKKISHVHMDNYPKTKEDREILVYVHPFSENHLHNFLGGGTITNVYAFSAMAFFILILACFNFVNLSTARSEIRFREVGIKKVVGSTRMQLIKQFLLETFLLSTVALLIAGILVIIFLPVINKMLGIQLGLFDSGEFILSILGITLFTGLLSGVYPAFFISSFKPVKILKGLVFAGTKTRSSLIRKILVVSQFSISIAFIICAIIIFNQLGYIRNKDLGFNKEHVLVFRMTRQLARQNESFKSELLKNPNIESASAISFDLIYWGSSSRVEWEGKKTEQFAILGYNWVDHDFLETFKMELVEGRFFSKEISSDLKDAFVVNEAAVKAMGLTDPVGKEIIRSPASTESRDTGKIIGVVKDYNFESLHGEIRPFCLIPGRYGTNMNVRIRSNGMSETIDYIGKTIKKFAPGCPFEYNFLDEKIDSQYRTDRLTGDITLLITGIAVFISSLGLFGLAAFSAERRTKEIGIRKAIGATFLNIIRLMSKEFVSLIVLANVIAWPVSWYLMNKFLQNYVFHIDIEIWVFFTAGITALIIAFLSIFHQALRAATSNPVDALRYE